MHNPTFSSYFAYPILYSALRRLHCALERLILLCSETTLLCSEKTLLCSEKTTLCSSKKNMYEKYVRKKVFFLMKYLVLRCENLWDMKSFPGKKLKIVKHFLPCLHFPTGAFFRRKMRKNILPCVHFPAGAFLGEVKVIS